MPTLFSWLLVGAFWLLSVGAFAQTSPTVPPGFSPPDSVLHEAQRLEKLIWERVSSFTVHRRSKREQRVVGYGEVDKYDGSERVIYLEKIKQFRTGLVMRTLKLHERVTDVTQTKMVTTARFIYFNERLAFARFYDSLGVRQVVVNNRYYN